MAKRFIFNMGYDTSHVISVLSSEGLETGSEVLLIISGNLDSRKENAIQEIRNYLDQVSVNTSLYCREASSSLEQNISKFSNMFSFSGNTVLSLSGGPRDHLIPLALAASVSASEIHKCYFRSDLNSDLQQISVPELSPELSESEKQILSVLEGKYLSVSEIVERVNVSESTVYGKLEDLELQNLVTEKKLKGSSRYKSSTSAQILVDEHSGA